MTTAQAPGVSKWQLELAAQALLNENGGRGRKPTFIEALAAAGVDFSGMTPDHVYNLQEQANRHCGLKQCPRCCNWFLGEDCPTCKDSEVY